MITVSLIPSHQVATWLLSTIRNMLNHIGLSHDEHIEEIIYVAAIVGVALLLGWVIRKIILWVTRKIVAWRHTEIGDSLLNHHILQRCSHIIPPLVILGLLPFAFDSSSTLLHLFRVGVVIYLIITITVAINAVIGFIWERYNARENTKNLPLAGIRNLCIGNSHRISPDRKVTGRVADRFRCVRDCPDVDIQGQHTRVRCRNPAVAERHGQDRRLDRRTFDHSQRYCH